MENYNQDSSSSSSFWQFSDQLRLESSNFVNLSLNDTIWGNSVSTKKPEQRRNFDIRVGGDRTFSSSSSSFSINKNNNIDGSSWNSKHNGTTGGSDYLNGFNDGWKIGTSSTFGGIGTNTNNNNNQKNLLLMNNTNVNINGGGGGGGFSKDGGVYSKFENNNNNMSTTRINNNNNKKKNEVVSHHEGKFSSSAGKKNNTTNSTINNNNNSVDKRFKTLQPSESLAKNQSVGGYIFVCNNDTMQENLQRQLFGLPPRYRDSVRAITPGLPLFLYNYSTHQLHGIFEASSFGGTNIDPTAWEDKKCPGESRFPAQVRVLLRKICEPLEEDSFRPVLHHYDGPKFRLELNVPEALALLDIFAEKST